MKRIMKNKNHFRFYVTMWANHVIAQRPKMSYFYVNCISKELDNLAK